MTKEKEHLTNVMARAKNAIINAVGDNSENVITDLKNMLNNENFKIFIVDNTEEDKDTEMENNDVKRKSIFQIEDVKTDDKEELEDMQVSGLLSITMLYNIL